MRIISFIACSCLVLIVNSAFAGTLDESTNFPDSSVQIKVRCQESGSGANCGIYAFGAVGERKIIDYPYAQTNISMTSGVFVIDRPCGTQCSATYFYSEKKGLGGPFPFVEAYDVDRGVVLLSQRNPLPMYAMFSKKSRIVGEVALDIPKGMDAFFAIKEAVVEDHRFVITYTSQAMKARWEGRNTGLHPATLAANYLVHPNDSQWQDAVVKAWAQANPDAIRRGASRTELEHLHEVHGKRALERLRQIGRYGVAGRDYIQKHYETLFGKKNQISR